MIHFLIRDSTPEACLNILILGCAQECLVPGYSRNSCRGRGSEPCYVAHQFGLVEIIEIHVYKPFFFLSKPAPRFNLPG